MDKSSTMGSFSYLDKINEVQTQSEKEETFDQSV